MKTWSTNRTLEPTEFELLSILAISAGLYSDLDYMKYPYMRQYCFLMGNHLGSSTVGIGYHRISYEEAIEFLKNEVENRKI